MNNNELTPKEQYEQRKAEKQKEKTQHDTTISSSSGNKFKPLLFIALGILVLWGAWSLFSGPSASDEQTADILASEWVKGSEEASVELVEYGDFQCPACAAAHPMVTQLHEEFGDDLKIVYRHYPLSRIHPHAIEAARAAEAAGVQGKFFEMHDMLFENQPEWSSQRSVTEIFEGYALAIGLDIEKYKSDRNSDPVKSKVTAHTSLAIDNNVEGTPTFVLNGEELRNFGGYEGLASMIRELLPDEVDEEEGEEIANEGAEGVDTDQEAEE